MHQFFWTITDLSADTKLKAVVQCLWKCSCGLNEFAGSVTLDPADTSSPGFIAYENLTEDLVLQWVFNLLGDEKILIEEQASKVPAKPPEPPFFNGIPWKQS
jgi:hypothetical protein